MGEFADELLGSLHEALAHAKGERTDLVTHSAGARTGPRAPI